MNKNFVLRLGLLIAVSYVTYFFTFLSVEERQGQLIGVLTIALFILPTLAFAAAGIMLAALIGFLTYRRTAFTKAAKVCGIVGAIAGFLFTAIALLANAEGAFRLAQMEAAHLINSFANGKPADEVITWGNPFTEQRAK